MDKATPYTIDAARELCASLNTRNRGGLIYLVVNQTTVEGDGFEFTGGLPAARTDADFGEAKAVKVFDSNFIHLSYL